MRPGDVAFNQQLGGNLGNQGGGQLGGGGGGQFGGKGGQYGGSGFGAGGKIVFSGGSVFDTKNHSPIWPIRWDRPISLNFGGREMPLRIAFAALLFTTAARAGEPKPPDGVELDKIIAGHLVAWKIPGLAAVIVRDDKMSHLAGYGLKSMPGNEFVTSNTIFPIASCSKAFASCVAASLVDSGDWDWDDPVRKHLPNFRIAAPDADKLIAIRDLMTHGTGLGGHDLIWYRAGLEPDEIVRRIGKLPLSAPFRRGYQYSSLPFTALGAAMENRTGKTYPELVRERLSIPLGMKSIAFTSKEAAKNPDCALGHELRSGKPMPMPAYEIKHPDAAGCIFLSARDLGAWLTFQLGQGKFEGKQIVSPKSLIETKIPHTPMRWEGLIADIYPESHQVSYGLGWVICDYRGEAVVAHGGQIDGFRVQITLLPKRGLGFALLNNLHETKANLALTNTLIDRYLGLSPKDWTAYYQKLDREESDMKKARIEKRNQARQANRPSVKLEAHVGEYSHPAYGRGTIKLDPGQLIWEWSAFRVPLEHWDGEQFRATGGYFDDELFEFQLDSDTGVKSLHQRGIVFDKK